MTFMPGRLQIAGLARLTRLERTGNGTHAFGQGIQPPRGRRNRKKKPVNNEIHGNPKPAFLEVITYILGV